uniref:Uncharacterized protein n=1 Tax=Octopus bimaculoides TaxID=37653 RepID=A0A0L8GEF7_OCTBM
MVLNSELNAANRINATNSLAKPVTTCSFGIIKRSLTDMQNMDGKICKILTRYRMHRPKSGVDRIYLSRKIGGRGLIQLEQSFKSAIINIETYFNTISAVFLRTALKHEDSKQALVMKLSKKFKMSLGLQVNNKNDQRCPNTDRPTIASHDLEINNQKDQRNSNSDKPITDAKKNIK